MTDIRLQKKRAKANEKVRQRNKATKSGLYTHACNFHAMVAVGSRAKAVELSRVASRVLNKIVTRGVIRANQATSRKPAINLTVNTLD